MAMRANPALLKGGRLELVRNAEPYREPLRFGTRHVGATACWP